MAKSFGLNQRKLIFFYSARLNSWHDDPTLRNRKTKSVFIELKVIC